MSCLIEASNEFLETKLGIDVRLLTLESSLEEKKKESE